MGKTIIDNYMDKRTNVNYTFVPIGVILPYGGGKAPTGFLICDGSAISRNTYKDLFDVIGSHYGDGNGSTTFNVPNLVDKFLRGTATATKIGGVGGADDVTLLTKNLPSHSHGLGNHTHTLSHTHTWDNTHKHSDNGHSHYIISSDFRGECGGSSRGGWNFKSDGSTGTSYADIQETYINGTTSDASNTTTSQASGNTDDTGSDTSFSIVPSYVNVQYIIKY